MKKLLWGALGIALAGGLGSAATAQEVVLKLATLAPPNTPWTKHLEAWKANVAEASGGAIEIQIFPAGQLGNEFETFKQVQRGRIDIGLFSGSPMTELVPEMALMSTPFLFDSSEVVDCVYGSGMGDALAGLVEERGVKFLQWGETGWVDPYAQDDLSDVAAAEGYKIRVSPQPMSRLIWSSVGANGVEIPYAETPAALQTGQVRGGESAKITYVAFGLGKLAPHFMKMNTYHLAGAIAMSERAWNRLDAEQQQILIDGLPPVAEFRAGVRGAGAYLLGKYAEAGGPVHDVTPEQRAAWKAMIEPNWPAFVEELGPKAQELWPLMLEAKAACEG